MVRCSAGVIVSVLLLSAAASDAAAQGAAGSAGKVEVGLFPVGGTFFVGGDDNREVDFNVYTSGGNLSYSLTDRLAIEGELTISFGLGQDVTFRRATVFHAQMPHVWGYSGSVLFFPGGAAGRRLPFYVIGGFGALALQSRDLTGPFGLDKDTVGFQNFVAENVGAGVKMFRQKSPDWGFRADYRYIIVNANEEAPAFFARDKTRGGHRLYFGVLFRGM